MFYPIQPQSPSTLPQRHSVVFVPGHPVPFSVATALATVSLLPLVVQNLSPVPPATNAPQNVPVDVATPFAHHGKILPRGGAVFHVAYSLLRAVEQLQADSFPLQLFAEVYCRRVDQCAWRYFYRCKSVVEVYHHPMTNANHLRTVLVCLYPKRFSTAALDRL